MILKPDFNTGTVLEADFSELSRKYRISAVLFDLDSTVMPSKSGVFPPAVLELFEKLKPEYTLAIVSNNKNENYLEKARRQTDIPIIGNAGKPNPKIILEFLKSKGIKPENALMAGDRPLTDILGGKCAGMKTMLVKSITYDRENFIVKSARILERLFVK